MNNLEQQIITRLKRFLSKYKMDIVKGADIKDTLFQNKYLVLAELVNNNLCLEVSNHLFSMKCYPYYWTSVDDMLFSTDNIFTFLYATKRAIDIRCCAGDSLEEIIIKMDLMGI